MELRNIKDRFKKSQRSRVQNILVLEDHESNLADNDNKATKANKPRRFTR